MGIFSSVSGKRGLSNSSTNMTNPIGFEECLRLCSQYDNWGGAKKPSPARVFRLTGPKMVLFEIYKAPDGRHLRRGVVFYSAGGEHKAHIFEWFDFGDGGCPTFNVRDELLHVSGDTFRTAEPFKVYEKKDTLAIGELNWNTATDEFAYREIYTTTNERETEVVDKIGCGDTPIQPLPSHENENVLEKKNPDSCADGKKEDAGRPVHAVKSQSRNEEPKQADWIVAQNHRRFCRILFVLIIDVIVGIGLWKFKDELPMVFLNPFCLTTSNSERAEPANQEQNAIDNDEQSREQARLEEECLKKHREAEEKRAREQQYAIQALIQQKESAEQQKNRMIEASQAAKQSGAEKYAVSEWEQGNVACKLGEHMFDIEAYEEAKKSYSEAENHFKMAEVKQQKKQMIEASQTAEQAGAKKYAVSEWNKGIAIWKYGDDMVKAESYDMAKESYSKAENHFKTAELTASKVEAKKMLDALPSLEARATDLIRENDRWFKWTVDTSALASMGDELYNVWKRIMVFSGKGLLNEFGDEDKWKLEDLIYRCYTLAENAKDKNPEAMKQMALRINHILEFASSRVEKSGAREHSPNLWNEAVANWNAGNDSFSKGGYEAAVRYYNTAERIFIKAFIKAKNK